MRKSDSSGGPLGVVRSLRLDMCKLADEVLLSSR